MMKNCKLSIGLLFLSLLFLVGAIGLYTFLHRVDKQTENNTMQFSATVDRIEISNTAKKVSVEIYTNEYNTVLLLSPSISKCVDLHAIQEVEAGHIISFRLENDKAQLLNQTSMLNIVSLKTEVNDILSLEDYNKYLRASAHPARVTCGFLIFLFLSAFIFNLILIVKKKR